MLPVTLLTRNEHWLPLKNITDLGLEGFVAHLALGATKFPVEFTWKKINSKKSLKKV